MADRQFEYEKEDHSAAFTNDFVFNQLIPYIGNKRKLLGLIQEAIIKTDVKNGTFLDCFAGSGVVSRMAKKMGYRVLCNDWEPYALEINRCYIEGTTPPLFQPFGGYEQAIAMLNALEPVEGWVARHLCPSDDTNYDILRDRMFYTRANGMMLDAIRAKINEWEDGHLIDSSEKASLLAPLLYQTCYTSNTSGVFKGFHNGWGGQTKTALYRILPKLQLKPAVFFDNQQANRVFKMESLEVAAYLKHHAIPVDIAYLDPPYNQHPYGSNYHVLNTIALWDSPPLTEKIQGRNKAAIREDWRTQRRSAYNYKGDAEIAYARLIRALDAKYILTSYSTDGMIPLPALVRLCVERGHTEVVSRKYKRYRVSSQRFSDKPVNIEFILVTDTSRTHRGYPANQLCERIVSAEEAALENHPETAYAYGTR